MGKKLSAEKCSKRMNITLQCMLECDGHSIHTVGNLIFRSWMDREHEL